MDGTGSKLKLATTQQTLEFLQGQYAKFRALNDSIKAQALEFNELVRAPLEKPEVPLRTLYIDLAMHDEMIRHSQNAKDTNKERITTLMRNKIAIEMMIRHREAVLESVTPVDFSEQKELDDVLLLVPESRRPDFRAQIETSWKKWRRGKITAQELMEALVQKCVVLGMRSIEDFRALFTILEFVTG